MSVLGRGSYGAVVALDDELVVKSFDERRHASRELMLARHLTALIAASPRSAAVERFARARYAFPLERHAEDDAATGFPRVLMPRHGVDLTRVVNAGGPVSTPELERLRASLVSGVAWLQNELGVVWCDAKPSNILRSRDPAGGWCIADFGLWRYSTASAPQSYAHPLELRSPELLCGMEEVALWLSDWWAVGLCLEFADRGGHLMSQQTTAAGTMAACLALYGGDGADVDLPPAMLARIAAWGLADAPRGAVRSARHDRYGDLVVMHPDRRAANVAAAIAAVEPGPDVGVVPVPPSLAFGLEDRAAAARKELVDAVCGVGAHHKLVCRLVIAAITVIDAVLHDHEPLLAEHGPLLAAAALDYCDNLLFESDHTVPLATICAEAYSRTAGEHPFRLECPGVLGCTAAIDEALEHTLPLGVLTWAFNTVDAVLAVQRDPVAFYANPAAHLP